MPTKIVKNHLFKIQFALKKKYFMKISSKNLGYYAVNLWKTKSKFGNFEWLHEMVGWVLIPSDLCFLPKFWLDPVIDPLNFLASSLIKWIILFGFKFSHLVESLSVHLLSALTSGASNFAHLLALWCSIHNEVHLKKVLQWDCFVLFFSFFLLLCFLFV